MKLFRVFLFLLSLYVYSDVQAQITFQKIYATADNMSVQDIGLTDDGGYIITGAYFYGPQYNESDIFLLKTDSAGNINWFKRISNAAAGSSPNSVKQTNDGGYILSGVIYDSANGPDIFLLKTNASGTVLWNKIFGTWSGDLGLEALQTNDGGYIILSLTGSLGTDSPYLIKTDSLGNEIWNTTINNTLTNFYGSSIRQTTDGGYIILGNSHLGFSSPHDFDILLVKINSAGTLLWCKYYDMGEDESPNSVEQTNDGGFIVCGDKSIYTVTDWDIIALKTDSAGTVEWTTSYGGAGEDYGYSAKQTIDGGYSFACLGGSQYILIKTDSAGNNLWLERYGNSNLGRVFHRQTNDSGYIIAGNTLGFGVTDMSIHLVKTNANRYSGCYESPANLPLLSSSVQTYTVTPIINSISFPSPPVSFTSTNIGAAATLCFFSNTNEMLNDYYLKVYPNPSPGDFVFEFNLPNNENVSVEIFDVVGKMILSQTIDHSPFTIKNSQLTNGVYSAVVIAGENKKAIKIVKIDR